MYWNPIKQIDTHNDLLCFFRFGYSQKVMKRGWRRQKKVSSIFPSLEHNSIQESRKLGMGTRHSPLSTNPCQCGWEMPCSVTHLLSAILFSPPGRELNPATREVTSIFRYPFDSIQPQQGCPTLAPGPTALYLFVCWFRFLYPSQDQSPTLHSFQACSPREQHWHVPLKRS